jgi:hypothetical protein
MPLKQKSCEHSKKNRENTKKSLGFGLLGAKLYELRKKNYCTDCIAFSTKRLGRHSPSKK